MKRTMTTLILLSFLVFTLFPTTNVARANTPNESPSGFNIWEWLSSGKPWDEVTYDWKENITIKNGNETIRGTQSYETSWKKETTTEGGANEPERGDEQTNEEDANELPTDEGKGEEAKERILGTASLDVWKSDKDEPSVAQTYLEGPVTVVERDGQQYARHVITSADWWQSFQVAMKGPYNEVTTVSTDKEKNTSVIEYPIDGVDRTIPAKVHIIVKGIPGFEYDNKYDIRLRIGALQSGTKPPVTQPGDGEQQKPDETKNPPVTKPDELKMTPVDFTIVKQSSDDRSVADGDFKKPAHTYKKNGKTYVRMTATRADWLRDFKVKAGGTLRPAKTIGAPTNNEQVYEFEVDSLNGESEASIHVVSADPGFAYDNTYTIRIRWGKVKEDVKETDQEQKEEKEEKKDDGKMKSVSFVVWKSDADERSVADQYFEKPAHTYEKNGKTYVRIWLNNESWWQSFRVKTGGTYRDVTTVETKGDKRLVEFPVDDLSRIVDGHVHIIVTGIPGFNYDNKYDIRLKFKATEKEENDPSGGTKEPGGSDSSTNDSKGSGVKGDDSSSNGNGTTGNETSSDGETKKETTTDSSGTSGGKGSPSSHGSATNSGAQATGSGETTVSSERAAPLSYERGKGPTEEKQKASVAGVNPKTADVSQIALYSSLLLASIFPLLWNVRHRIRW